MSAKTTVCLLGCGGIAGFNVRPGAAAVTTHIQAINAHPAYELIGCYDRDQAKAQEFCAIWSLKAPFSSLEQALVANADLYVIATSTDSHFSILNALLDSQCRGVICEKPLVYKPSELKVLKQRGINKKVYINFTRRFDQNHREVVAHLQNGPYGQLHHFHASIAKGLIHNGSHMIDLLSWIFRGVKSLSPIAARRVADDLYGSFLCQTETSAPGIVSTYDKPTYSMFDLQLYFEKAVVKIEDLGRQISISCPEPSQQYPGFFDLLLKKQYEPTLHNAIFNLYETYANDTHDYHRHFTEVVNCSEIMFNCLE